MNGRQWLGAGLRLAALTAATLTLTAAPASRAQAASLRVMGMKRISSHTPFPGPCARDSPIVNVGAEVEPYLAADPRNPRVRSPLPERASG